ncbi:MAG TPA: hypothetical protein PK110_15990 [Niabella sp.]|nr:hypothetical protein [Chitinophagaceae bacterium]HRO86322.1 hypothetical protein [Niabella sp.]
MKYLKNFLFLTTGFLFVLCFTACNGDEKQTDTIEEAAPPKPIIEMTDSVQKKDEADSLLQLIFDINSINDSSQTQALELRKRLLSDSSIRNLPDSTRKKLKKAEEYIEKKLSE